VPECPTFRNLGRAVALLAQTGFQNNIYLERDGCCNKQLQQQVVSSISQKTIRGKKNFRAYTVFVVVKKKVLATPLAMLPFSREETHLQNFLQLNKRLEVVTQDTYYCIRFLGGGRPIWYCSKKVPID
jgi:hypothetical protein